MKSSKGSPDFLLLCLTLLMVGFGLVMVFSASSSTAVSSAKFNNNALYFTERQFIWAGLGTFVMLFVMNIPYAKFKKLFIPFFVIVVAMLIAVLFVGEVVNGSKSWFNIGP